VNPGIALFNKFRPAQLRQAFPVVFEDIEGVAVLKVFERNQSQIKCRIVCKTRLTAIERLVDPEPDLTRPASDRIGPEKCNFPVFSL
jgi:hypothetical protein